MSTTNYLVDVPYLKQKYGSEIISLQRNQESLLKIISIFLDAEDIHPGQKWIGCNGERVTVKKNENGWITYTWMQGEKQIYHEKSVFSFQVRYSLLLPKLNR